MRSLTKLSTIPKQITSKRSFSSHQIMRKELKIGYVPEHFSTPLHFAQKHFSLSSSLHPYPSGTGHMVQALQSSEIDIGIGLTEGWVNGLAKLGSQSAFKIVGSYVKTPLCWAISTGVDRDISVDDIKGGKVGVSRIGSGSYVMPFVLADQKGWLAGKDNKDVFEFVELGTFDKLRKGVKEGTADVFMWEHFTSKRYWDKGEIKRIGEIYTPWASWKITARKDVEKTQVEEVLDKLNSGIRFFEEHKEEAVRYISTELDYSEEDAREWLKTVELETNTKDIGIQDLDKTIGILGKAGVLDPAQISTRDLI